MHDVAYGRYRFDTVAGSYLDAMEDLLVFDAYREQRIRGPIRIHGASLGCISGMNQIAQTFVNTDAEWLFLTDADMSFPVDALYRLLYAADKDTRPIMSALTFKYQLTGEDSSGGTVGEERPVILDWTKDPETGATGFVGRMRYPANTVLKCSATGMACVVIHRSVPEAILEKFGPVWHDPMPNPLHEGKTLGTDVSYWVRAGLCGFDVHVHTGVLTSHQKTCWVSQDSYVKRMSAAGIDVHEGFDTVPAPEPPKTPTQNRKERRALARTNR